MKSNRAAVNRAIRRETDERLEKSGLVIQNAQKEEIVRMKVIDTGRTLSSVEYVKVGDTVYIGTRLNYARFPALGTRYMEPRPWPVTGANAARPALKAIWSAPTGD